MSNIGYKIVYRGERVEGFTDEEIKRFIVKSFKTSEEKADEILNSRMAVLRKNLDEKTAEHYRKTLEQAGLKVTIETMAPEAPFPKAHESRDKAASSGPGKTTPPPFTPPALDRSLQSTPGASHQTPPARMPFEFQGTGTEYFKIWIVNIILSILTFGIYSAWAKVRRKQYFYGNTRINGSSFQYLADPVKILKGRIAVFLFFITYSILSEFFPLIGAVLSVGFIIILPWIVLRSLAFNARNSALRNIRFGFNARIWDAAKAFVLWPMAGALTFGILMPFVYYKQKKFVVEHSRYGITKFEFNATPGDYYKIFLMLTLPLVGGVVLGFVGFFIFPPILLLIGLVLYLYIFAFIAVKTSNLFYNAAKLSRNGFRADMEVLKYGFILATNSIATALTLGLYHPWAKVRALKYKIQHLVLIPGGDVDAFIAGEEKQVSAIGDEMSDFMDFDFGL